MNIENRFFADGGLEHNNPSFAIYFHYTSNERKRSTRPGRVAAPTFSPHDNLDCSRVRFTNIGTGAHPDEVVIGKRDRLAGLVPGTIRRAVFLKQTLTEIAVNSDEKVEIMRQFEDLKPDVFKYERFDADHGVSNIKLDRYDALDEIRQKTELYLDEQETKDLLGEVGEAIAKDYLSIQSTHKHNNGSTHPVIDQSHQSPQDAPSSMPASPSISTAQSTSSKHPDTMSHMENTNHDRAKNNGSATLNQHAAEPFLSPSHPIPAHEHSETGALESGNPMAAASA